MMLSLEDKGKLIEELLRENPECTIGEYLDCKGRPELVAAEPKHIYSFNWPALKTG